METSLTRINQLKNELAKVTNISQARRLLSISEGLLTAIKKEYKATELASEAKEDRDKAYSAALGAAEIRLIAEAKLGELLQKADLSQRQRDETGKYQGCNDATLANLGIEKTESFRAQRIYEHQDLIPQVVEKAKERGDLPTRSLLEHEIMMSKESALKPMKLEMQLPYKTYKTIVIDPPWPVEKIQREERPYQDVWDYPKIPLDFLEKANIERLADYQGCHLYLWTTHRYLPNAFDMVLTWGFKYQCLLTWVKNVGMTPFSWMYSTEHILFCKKGNLPLLQLGKRLDFAAKVREHSRKPDEFYDLVREVSPEPRLDMFSREPREGFDSWGNETNKF